MIEIVQVPALKDNYIYLLRDEATGRRAVIDPGEAAPILEELGDQTLDYILITHHHWDHVDGVLEVKERTGAKVVGFADDSPRIPGFDLAVKDGAPFELGESRAKVLHIPGHTLGQVAYWFEDSRAVFPGDTLFTLGCGRLFEGTAEQMWSSLQRLRGLPDVTRLFCAHEYTESNARFAVEIDPGNERLLQRAARTRELRALGRPTVPSTLGEERLTNPFLRADDPELQRRLGSSDAQSAFAEIRRRKDHFKG